LEFDLELFARTMSLEMGVAISFATIVSRAACSKHLGRRANLVDYPLRVGEE